MKSVKESIFLAVFIPVVATSVVLGGAYISNWSETKKESIDIKGKKYALDTARLSEFAIFSENYEYLELLSSSLLNDYDVYQVKIFDRNNKVLVSTIANRYINDISISDKQKYYVEPVYSGQLTQINNDDYSDQVALLENEIDYIGSISVSMTTYDYEKNLILKLSELIVVIVVISILSFLLSIYISRHLTKPILNMKRNIALLENGEEIEQSNTYAGNELGELEKSFQNMTIKVNISKYNLQKQIDIATAGRNRVIDELTEKNRQLNNIKKDLIDAIDSKTTFFARMSHEIRTPIQSIIGYISLLKKTTLNPSQDELLKVVQNASHHLLFLINNLLEISNIDSIHNNKHSKTVFNIITSIEDSVILLKPQAHAKGLVLVIIVESDDIYYVEGIEYYLKQILINIIANAIKYSNHGEIVVRVSIADKVDDLIVVDIDVTDTGIGIADDKINNLMEPFYQVNTDLNTQHDGVGLGLTIVEKLLDKLGGNIVITSKLGVGSSFNVSIPYKIITPHVKEAAFLPFANNKLLCFDRHTIVLKSLRNRLLGWSLNVFTTSSLKQVSEAILKNKNDERYELLILGLDKEDIIDNEVGPMLYELLQSIRIPVLLLKPTDDALNIQSYFYDRVPFDIQSKPITSKTLYESILSLLSGISENSSDCNSAQAEYPAMQLANKSEVINILLAEDNDYNRYYIASLLADYGMNVVEASDGAVALNLALENHYDLILMDIHLPAVDGVKITASIRNTPGPNSSTPIIALTADVFIDNDPAYGTAEFNGVIHKPINENNFHQLLTEYVQIDRSKSLINIESIKHELQPKLYEQLAIHKSKLLEYVSNMNVDGVISELHQLKGVCEYMHVDELTGPVATIYSQTRSSGNIDAKDIHQLIDKLGDVANTTVSSNPTQYYT